MKMATTIDRILCKAKIEPGIAYLPQEDWDQIDKALAELAKLTVGKGQYGVIKNSYVDYLANVSFFCGVALTAGTIVLLKKAVELVKQAKDTIDKEESK